MNAAFYAAIEIDAGFKLLPTDDLMGDAIVSFTEADAKALQSYYYAKGNLTDALLAKLEVMSEAFSSAPLNGKGITLVAGNVNTAQGMFHILAPAMNLVEMLLGGKGLDAYRFGAADLPHIGVKQMSALMIATIEACNAATAQTMAEAAAATKH